MNHKSLFHLLLLILLWGCHKDESKKEVIFQGLVIDYDTSMPKPGVTVILKRFDAFVMYPCPSYYAGLIMDSTVTDENGNYQFTIDQNNKPLYKVAVSEDGYLEKIDSPQVLATFIDFDSRNEDTIRVGQESCLRFELVNVPDSYDSIYIRGNTAAFRLCPQFADTSILHHYLYKDNHMVYIIWEITDKPDNNTFDSVVQLIPLDTTTFHIEF